MPPDEKLRMDKEKEGVFGSQSSFPSSSFPSPPAPALTPAAPSTEEEEGEEESAAVDNAPSFPRRQPFASSSLSSTSPSGASLPLQQAQVPREASAEDIWHASIHFEQQNSNLIRHGQLPYERQRNHSGSLYPTLRELDEADSPSLARRNITRMILGTTTNSTALETPPQAPAPAPAPPAEVPSSTTTKTTASAIVAAAVWSSPHAGVCQDEMRTNFTGHTGTPTPTVTSTTTTATAVAYAVAAVPEEEEEEEKTEIQTINHEQQNTPPFASASVQQQQQRRRAETMEEETKEEMSSAPLASMPTYAVSSAPWEAGHATVLGEPTTDASGAAYSAASSSPYAAASASAATAAAEAAYYYEEEGNADPWEQAAAEDLELRALKLQAANGGDGASTSTLVGFATRSATAAEALSSSPHTTITPEPWPDEEALAYYCRTRDFWSLRASETLTQAGATVSLRALKEEGIRLARERWEAYQQPLTQHAEATIVAIDGPDTFVHRQERLSPHEEAMAVQAEFVGQDYHHHSARHVRHHSHDSIQGIVESVGVGMAVSGTYEAVAVPGTPTASASTAAPAAVAVHQHNATMGVMDRRNTAMPVTLDETEEFAAGTEATVIDSAPLNKEEAQNVWCTTEVAQVLEEDTTGAVLDQKPAAIDRSATRDDDRNGFAVADQEAEVLDIEEDVHPDEFVVADAEAQMVGTDYDYDYSSSPHIAAETTQIEENVHPSEFTTVGAQAEVVETTTHIQEEIHPSEFTTIDAQAEVVGTIQEDMHPSEEAFGAQAEVVGAVEEGIHTSTINAQAEVVGTVEEDVHPSEFGGAVDAQAEVVGTTDSVFSSSPNITTGSSYPLTTEAPVPALVSSEEVVATAAATMPVQIEANAVLVETPQPERKGSVTPTKEMLAEPSYQNPFADDPNDTPTMDARYDDSWMSTPTVVSDGMGPPPVALAAPTKDDPWSGVAQPDGNTRNLGENDNDGEDAMPNWLRSPPPQQQGFGGNGREPSSGRFSSTGGSEGSSNSQSRIQLQNLSNNIARGTGQVMEVLFGEQKGPFVGRKSRTSQDDITGAILPRRLLPWSVIFSPTSKMWVATLQTSQKAIESKNVAEASKALRAFSLPSEKQAVSLAKSWTPARTLPFADNPLCHICQAKFAVFRRACHCRNCGVCICKECCVLWPSKMVPDTYNIKKENPINACKSCDWLCNMFRLALLNGNMDEAVALHATGNINLSCPFNNVKGELFFPVHCAVLGGNLELLRWLVEENCCPIKSVRVSGRTASGSGQYTPIVTSKGRSLLGIAMEKEHVHIVRYLVVDKGLPIVGEKDVTPTMLYRNLDKVLRLMPALSDSASVTNGLSDAASMGGTMAPTEDSYRELSPMMPNAADISDEAQDFAIYQHRAMDDSAINNTDECIICFDNKIDCVATPCGHQICCLKCSENISRCPVCATDCSYLRVFKP